MLVVGDWFLLRNSNIRATSKAALIETKRLEKDDKSLIERAVLEGYSPPLSPSVMDTLRPDYPLIAGLPNTDTYLCNEGYGLIKYRSDRFGFRNNDEDWDRPNKKIMIGDSFVHGACVTSRHTLTKNIEKNTNEVILNLGIGGNNPSDYLTYGELFIPKVMPSDVYLVFYPNDNGLKNPSILEQVYVDEGRKLFSPTELQLFDTEFFKSEGLKLLDILRKTKSTETNILKTYKAFRRHASLPIIVELLSRSNKQFEKTKQTIQSIDELCRYYACNLTVVFIPNSDFWQPDPRADSYGDKIAELTSGLGLEFVDGRYFIDSSEDSKDYAIKGGHLSPLGYEKIAKAITSSATD